MKCRMLPCTKRDLIETADFKLRTITPLLMTAKQLSLCFARLDV